MNAPSANRIKIAPGFWTSLRGIGVEPIDVARQARLPLTVINEPLVTTDQYYSIWQAFSELVGDTATGIVRLATAYETAQGFLLSKFSLYGEWDKVLVIYDLKFLSPHNNGRQRAITNNHRNFLSPIIYIM
ncbi:hypothetical protein N6H14_26015 [Paenibacillus sp. CC-CFT747]|nr:hypothetical protein N6H14_26015 [Paenibacillus sp. CC-CFT747]